MDALTGPLSFQQEDVLRKARKHPASAPGYDYCFLFRLEGAVDVGHLRSALEELLCRHPVLRTRIARAGTDYVQSISAVEGFIETDGGGAVTESGMVQELIAQRHDLDKILKGEALLRATIHTAPQVYLSLTINHLIYDGWSLMLLWRDLAELYAARIEHRAPDLPQVRATYLEFAEKQRTSWEQRKESATEFLAKAVEGYQDTIAWPASGEINTASEPELSLLSFDVPPSLTSRIREVSRAARVSPFTVLLSATALAVARVTGKRDLMMGTDTFNRDEETWESVGHFVNTRITRVGIDPTRPLIEAVQLIRASWMAADDYGDVFSEKVLADIGAPFPLMVNMPSLAQSSGNMEVLRLKNIAVESVPVPVKNSTWRDFYATWFHDKNGYRGVLSHRTARVDNATARMIFEEIESGLADPFGDASV
ncbi:condensation domain-containing protein [Streptomyces sp. NPDC058525]|uniref:condensation domain-containing protein n=1 Tax=Streptomyces sp. NPDC058525 TaxID=3346538 RepID=UPI0036544C46